MADGEEKSANAKSEIVRKPSRRSPTTGHRRKKTDLKRSQSSPREVIVPTSSDDERVVPTRRKSLSPGLGPEPKKVLRRRHRVKETPKTTTGETIDDPTINSILKTRLETEPASTEESHVASGSLPQGIAKYVKQEIETNANDAPRRRSVESKPKDKKEEKQKETTVEEQSISKTHKQGENETIGESTKPNSWWGGWSPFRKKTESEATSVESRVEDSMTSDDETAAEFIKLLSGKPDGEVKPRKQKLSSDDVKWSVDDEKTPLLSEEPEKSWRQLISESRSAFVKYRAEFPKETATIRKLANRCVCELLIMFIFCGCGAFVFKTTEGTFESFYKCGVKRVKRDFIDDLWRSSHFMKEEDWKSKARSKLWQFENQLQEAFEAGINTYSGQKSWSFINSIIYCMTVVTTIGYGHIAPVTNSGRALTIAYSIIGIPLFLILLADFGKLFTRGIKFLWAFVRRLYYTGSCKKVRRTGPVQEVMKGVQMVYETIRRPSMFPQGPDGPEQRQDNLGTPGDPPSTPALSAFAIDDEFNLPISVAITILLVYIFMGATVFWCWEEEWTFFESFYFVFISMSTIGFGDLVPKNQMYMMLSIVYLAFGLALTSMCINVVQEKLSNTFRKASAKIGATIGLKVSDDDGTVSPVSPTHVEIAEVHKPLKTSDGHLTVNPQHEIS